MHQVLTIQARRKEIAQEEALFQQHQKKRKGGQQKLSEKGEKKVGGGGPSREPRTRQLTPSKLRIISTVQHAIARAVMEPEGGEGDV